MTAAELYEVVKDVPREAWPTMLRNHSTFDQEEPERFWIIYGPRGGDDKRCVHITAAIAELAFVGSMTAWLMNCNVFASKSQVDETYWTIDMNELNKRSGNYRTLVAALAAACKEAA